MVRPYKSSTEVPEMPTAATRSPLLSIPLIAALLVGCASASTSSPPVEASVPASVAGSEVAAPSFALCDPGTICTGALLPGDYASTGTGASIAFTLADEGWSADADTAGVGFALYRQDPGGPAGITVAPWAGVVFTDPCTPDPKKTIGAMPADLMGVITGFDGVTADAPADVTVGGLPALVVNLTVAGPCPDAGGKLWVFETSGGATFNLRDETQARIYAVNAGSFTIVIAIEALGDADYEALLQKAEAFLATMVISPGS
jgi:hypothetical protein